MGSWRFYPALPHAGLHHLELAARYGGARGPVVRNRQWDVAVNYYVHRNLRFMVDVIVPDDPLPHGERAVFQGRANVRF